MINIISGRIGEQLSPFLGRIQQSPEYKEMARIRDVVIKTVKEKFSNISGITSHLRITNLFCQLTNALTPVSKKVGLIFTGIKGFVSNASCLAAIASLHGTCKKIDEKLGSFFEKKVYETEENITGRALVTLSLIVYLFSRIVVIANYCSKVLHVPGLEGFLNVVSLPNQIGLFIGGVCQVSVHGGRLLGYLAPSLVGRVFSLEENSDLSAEANAIEDLLKFGEGLAWIAEAGIMLAGCTNPLILLSAALVSTGIGFVQLYTIPIAKEYFPKTTTEKDPAPTE